MIEFKEQKKIIDVAKTIEKPPIEQRGLRAYQELICSRFYEVLSNAFPIFFEIVDKEEFEQNIYRFMNDGAKTPYIWKVPNEFRDFVKKKKLFKTMKYVDDLLWFEWIEIKLMMKNYKDRNVVKFDYKKKYKKSDSCALKKIKFKVHEKKFDEPGTFFLLAYYDFAKDQVFFREISQILYIFIKTINKDGIHKGIEKISNLTEESPKVVIDFLKPTLKELYKLGVLGQNNKRK
ncbi:MAG: putative DNA-binding domain-containing protein [Sulfurospirillaceae bacterium]|nr:putative DNA-binding domain-containing protein [Sulfurospirillaceae bacterium]